MIKLTSSNGDKAHNINEYVCDTVEDLKNVPTYCGMGSTCIVIATSEIYMLNGLREWVKL